MEEVSATAHESYARAPTQAIQQPTLSRPQKSRRHPEPASQGKGSLSSPLQSYLFFDPLEFALLTQHARLMQNTGTHIERSEENSCRPPSHS